MNTFIFVYGSLKRGCSLHHLLEQQQFVGTAITRPIYRIFNLGSYPGLIDFPDGTTIHGEVYVIDQQGLAQLDDAEGVADGLYARREICLDTSTLPASFRGGEAFFFAWFWLRSVAGRADCGNYWTP
ncbi:MAG: gamma-glutamylcyclotransferase [Planctomycetota bacterium]